MAVKPRAEEIDIEVGGYLRKLRRAAGLSQEKLADSIGLTFQQIQKYERGINRISVGTLLKLAKALGVHPTAFMPEEYRTESVNHGVAIAGRYLVIQECLDDILFIAKKANKGELPDVTVQRNS
jgi:transcriptional regulator with XRE-family HTH domain